ncbi:hypothetical protein [Hymenobacter volaticus]|uniref:hypothetical protein n=1 Tax=Hymenobacter volaticus TaxID=2932254 RepID=UPI001FD6B015|nr:hypothetical protein [Hymenobacter volaticus]
MRLSFLQFRDLSYSEQAAYFSAHRTYLARRYTAGFTVHLYYLGSFFCEEWICQTQNELRLLRPFTGTEQLLPYTELVHLPSL